MNIVYLPHAPAGYLKRATDGSAGHDLRACSVEKFTGMAPLYPTEQVTVSPGQVVVFGTGIKLDIASEWAGSPIHETGLCGLIVPRSGLGSQGLQLANTVGVIDQDYRGEILVGLRNVSDQPLVVEGRQRVAQLLFVPVFLPQFNAVERHLSSTERGEGGFGSTGSA